MAINKAEIAIFYGIGISPRIQKDAPPVDCSPQDTMFVQFRREDAILGEHTLPSGARLMAVHNGLPYLAGDGTIHFMNVFAGNHGQVIGNPSEAEICDLADVVGMSRRFLRNGDGVRMVGYQINAKDGHRNPEEKGKMAQTLEAMHWHNIKFPSWDHIIAMGNASPESQMQEYANIARAKSIEPYANLSMMLMKRVVRDASSRAHLVGATHLVQNPQHVTKGALSLDTTNLAERDMAIFLQSLHDAQKVAWEEMMSIFHENATADPSLPRVLRNRTARTVAVSHFMAKIEREGIYDDIELTFLQNRLLHLAKSVQSEAQIRNAQRPHSTDPRPNSAFIPWRTFSYAVCMSIENGQEFLTVRAHPFSNAGFMEMMGLAPIRLRNKTIDPMQYDEDHDRARDAFSNTIYGTAINGGVFTRL